MNRSVSPSKLGTKPAVLSVAKLASMNCSCLRFADRILDFMVQYLKPFHSLRNVPTGLLLFHIMSDLHCRFSKSGQSGIAMFSNIPHLNRAL